jgi:hypothetical protein
MLHKFASKHFSVNNVKKFMWGTLPASNPLSENTFKQSDFCLFPAAHVFRLRERS